MSLQRILLASVFAVGLTVPAVASDVTDGQAHAVADQLRGWLANLLANRVAVPPGLLNVSPDGAAYRLTLMAPNEVVVMRDPAGQPTDFSLTLRVRPDTGTRWVIESAIFPSALSLSPDAAAFLAAALPTAPAAATGVPPKAPPTVAWHAGNQSASGVFDTALATESRLEVQLFDTGTETTNLGTTTQSQSNADRIGAVYRLRPNASGGTDVSINATIDGYAGMSQSPPFGVLEYKARRVGLDLQNTGLMTNQLGDLIRMVVVLATDADAAKKAGPEAQAKNEQVARGALRGIIGMLKGITTGLALTETVEGLDLRAATGRGQADKIGFEMGGQAPADTLDAHMDISARGLDILGLPPQSSDFIPKSFRIRPTVANIDVKALTKLAADASEEGASAAVMQARLTSLFVSHGVRIGFEHLDADLGYASIAGSGEATVVGPQAIRGTADVSVTGFDALMQHVQAQPRAAQAMAVLIMAKGLAKTDGGKMVWHIAYSEDRKILINGVDLAAMAPRPPGAGPAPR